MGGGGGSLWENPVLVHIQAAVINNKSDTIHKVGKELFWQKKPHAVTQQTCLCIEPIWGVQPGTIWVLLAHMRVAQMGPI